MFSLSSLYPCLDPVTHSTLNPQPIFPSSAQSIAILNGNLPASSPIHLALAHLSYDDLQQRNARGVIEGEDDREPRRVLLLTRETGEWASALLRDGEDWMRTRGGRSGVLKKLDRVDIKYCPTATHLALLLSMLSTSPEKASHPALSMDGVPSLIIVHQPSLYFFESSPASDTTGEDDPLTWTARPSCTSSSYGALVQLALQLTAHYRKAYATSCRIVIYEPLASALTLPIMTYKPSQPAPKIESSTSKQARLAKEAKEMGWIPKVSVKDLVSSMVDLVVDVPLKNEDAEPMDVEAVAMDEELS